MSSTPQHETATPHEESKGRAEVIQPDDVKIWEDAFHRLYLSVQGREFGNVRAVRAFPISGKADYISFLDEQRKEVALLAHPRGLDKASRRALEKALERMYYVPKIVRVDSITENPGISHWEVLTDRGYASFELTDREHIRKLPGRRYLVHDADGNRFEIEDLAQLDKRSQELVQSEI
jgi:hypothetical protein